MLFTDEQLLDFYKLKYVVRYNTSPHLKEETVAEHSFYVALFAMILCDKYNIAGKYTKMSIVAKAILHDMPEIETNDITHDAKEKMNLRGFLEKYELDYYKREFPDYYDLMSDKNELINDIVTLADYYSVYQFVLNETQLGNQSKYILEIKDDIIERISTIEKRLEKYL